MTNENMMNVKILERCFDETVDKEMIIFVDKVEDRIQNAVLTNFIGFVAPKTELPVRPINASSGQNATSVTFWLSSTIRCRFQSNLNL